VSWQSNKDVAYLANLADLAYLADKDMIFDEQNFETEVLSSDGPVLVDFFATWCGQCPVLALIVDELEVEMSGMNVKIGKLDVDKASAIAAKYDIMGVPTTILFKNGEVKEVLNGLQTKADLRKKLEELI